jgi:16S rRNA pseudouridine516 synthase
VKIRIDKWISDSSEYSRKEVKNFFKYNKIKLNGEVVKKSGMIVDTDNDMVTLLEKEIIYEEKIYIMLNKPSGYISSAIVEGEKTIMELLDLKYQRRLFPIGRLDKDTEGLILLTNDGQYSHKLMHPNKKVSKIYYVEVDNDLEEKFVDIFSSGVDIGDYFTKPATLKIINETTCTLEIQEGKFHQVKRMFEAVGCEVIYLKRIQIGKLELDENLKNGEYRKLNQEETEKALIGD